MGAARGPPTPPSPFQKNSNWGSVVAARICGGPPDNRRVVVCNFELWRFGDLDVLSPLLRRKDLSSGWVGRKQAADRGGDRQLQEQSIHPSTEPIRRRFSGFAWWI
jgi:hypothetical protein